ncbi:MAG: 2-oxoacid:acceptor oxidoreductase family protein [Clostridia bacterium]|nr:2-oxoacid:acceptor oxidoreductase family protein [Clostridia bacterium]
MSMTKQILITGFGGQGILFAGKFLAFKGMHDEKQVSWLPSYGPEMRGGTASCSVIISDLPVGSPIVTYPDCLIAMNLPSLDKYEKAVVAGGQIYVDSTLITRKVERTDVDTFYIPATQMASDEGLNTLANMIIMGKLIKESGFITYDNIEDTLKKFISAKHMNLLQANLKAIELGYNYN